MLCYGFNVGGNDDDAHTSGKCVIERTAIQLKLYNVYIHIYVYIYLYMHTHGSFHLMLIG